VRNIKRQGAAGKWQTVHEQMGAEFGQQSIGTRAIGGGINEPRKSRRKLHYSIMGRRTVFVTADPQSASSLQNSGSVGGSAAQSGW
jgi:hypothetical protein